MKCSHCGKRSPKRSDHLCDDCYGFDDEDDDNYGFDDEDDEEPEPIGECVECGNPTYGGDSEDEVDLCSSCLWYANQPGEEPEKGKAS